MRLIDGKSLRYMVRNSDFDLKTRRAIYKMIRRCEQNIPAGVSNLVDALFAMEQRVEGEQSQEGMRATFANGCGVKSQVQLTVEYAGVTYDDYQDGDTWEEFDMVLEKKEVWVDNRRFTRNIITGEDKVAGEAMWVEDDSEWNW